MQTLFLSPYIGTLSAIQTLGILAEHQLRAQYALGKTMIGMAGFSASPAPTPRPKAPATKPRAKTKPARKPANTAAPEKTPAPKAATKPAPAKVAAAPTPARKRPRAPSTPPAMPSKETGKAD